MIRIEEICDKVRRNHPQADLNLLRRAYLFSAREHRGQKRASGESYLVHPLEVANILADMRLDAVSVSTGLLHDVVEDTLADASTIREYFGEEVAHLVEGLTKIAHISKLSREEQQAENVRKMLLAMVDDVRVVLVKLADRLHNMRTLEFLSLDKRRRIAQETMDIYAPIAHRLGMGKLRGELEDLAFKNLHPEDYRELTAQLEKRRAANEAFLNDITATIAEKMREADVPFTRIEGRVKRLYSIWKKLGAQEIDIDQVYDLIAARVITPNEIRHCYGALGVIHNAWKPVPGRFKDWIATPRDNLYQSLHTSVIGSKGQPFEVQIRTEQMHLIAEEGVAAHWKYKEGKRGPRDDDEALKVLRSLVEWTQEVKDSREFIDALKLDLYPKDVYANRVRHWVADQQRTESIEIGRKLLEKEAGRFQLSIKKMLSDSNGDLKRISSEYGYGRTDDLLAAIGYGKIVPRNVIAKYLGPEKFEALDKQKESRLRTGVRAVKRLITGDDAIVVRGVEDLMVNRARCCNPLHGEQIIGYITRGKGVAVHTARCKNVKQLMVNPERIVAVEWASKPEKTAYAVKLLAVTENRTGMIAGITGAISDMKTGIRDARASVGPDQKGRIEVTVEVFDVKHLDKVMSSVKNVSGVLDVERLQGAA